MCVCVSLNSVAAPASFYSCAQENAVQKTNRHEEGDSQDPLGCVFFKRTPEEGSCGVLVKPTKAGSHQKRDTPTSSIEQSGFSVAHTSCFCRAWHHKGDMSTGVLYHHHLPSDLNKKESLEPCQAMSPKILATPTDS